MPQHTSSTPTPGPMPACTARARISPAVMKLSCPTNSPGAYADTRARCSARSNGTRSSCFMAVPRSAACRRRAERGEKAVTERRHRPDGRLRTRPHAVLPVPPGDPAEHPRVVGDDRDRYVVPGALAADERRGLMVAQEDDYELVVAVALHEREDRAHRVLDRTAVGGAGSFGVAEERGVRGLLRRDAAEDRAVADVVPGDESRDARPRRVARDEVRFREHGAPVRPGELLAVEGLEDVLVGHRGQAEARAAVADVPAVVDLVVVVEARALRPRPLVGRHGGDRSPPRALEGLGQREAVAPDELVVAPLGADPDPRLQGGVRQPAEPAEGRRAQEGAAGAEAPGSQLRAPVVEHGVDPRREGRALDGDPA